MAANNAHDRTVNARSARAVMLSNTAERYARIGELSRQGMSTEVISEMLGVSSRTVERARSRAAGSRGRSKIATEADKLRAKEMLVDGASYTEVGRTLGFGYEAVKKWHPGFTYTRKQVAHAGVMSRRMAELDKRTKNGLVDC